MLNRIRRTLSGRRSSSEETRQDEQSRVDEDALVISRKERRSADTSAEDFQQIEVLGVGGFGEVWLARHHTTGKLFAMKKLQKKQLVRRRNTAARVIAERNIHSKLEHPFIVRLEYAFQSKDEVFLVLEYIR